MFSIIRELPHLKAHKYYLSPCTQLLPSVTACQCPAPGLDRRYAAVPAGLRAYYNKATVGLGPGRRYSSLKARGRSCICILYWKWLRAGTPVRLQYRHACTVSVQAPVRAHGRHAGRCGHSQPFGGQCPRLPLKNETGTNPYY